MRRKFKTCSKQSQISLSFEAVLHFHDWLQFEFDSNISLLFKCELFTISVLGLFLPQN